MTVRVSDCLDSTYIHALNGQHVEVYVRITTDVPVGNANIRLRYAFPGLTFLGATATGHFTAWEHFTWNHQPDTLFPDSGYATIDLAAVADLPDSAGLHPDPAALTLDGRVVRLHFCTSSNRNLQNQCASVLLSDFECGQFVLLSQEGDIAHVPAGSDWSCPSLAGQTVIDDIGYASGAVCINNPPDDRGDINLNGYEFDIGDAVLLCKYLIYGDDVWDPVWKDVQVLSTDVNDDGIVGTVGDFVFLLNLIAAGGLSTYSPGNCQ